MVSSISGSVGVLSEAIHSSLDLVSSIITFFVVRTSGRPADSDHPFGHGKFESLSAMLEAALLLVAGVFILYEGVSAWGSGNHHVEHLGWGLAVTGFSVVLNLFVYLQNRHVAKAEESLAIETNAFHFLTDMYTSLAVFASLGILQFTGWDWLDPLVALLIAAYVFWIGIEQILKCLAELSDTVLPPAELDTVKLVLEKHAPEYINYHDLRTRRSGTVRHVELHLEVCSDQSVAQAHGICDRIEDGLIRSFKDVDVNIHVEPCGNHGPGCSSNCSWLKRSGK